jgi:hypothetical protein
MKKIGLIALLIVCSITFGGSIAFAVYAAPSEQTFTIVETVEVEETTINDEKETTEPVEETTVIEVKETVIDNFMEIQYYDTMDLRTIDGIYLPECENYLVRLNEYLADEKWVDEINIIKEEIAKVEDIKKLYLERIEYIEYTEQYNEYPVATKIWYFLKGLGYSDYVCAGILGNIMAEAGGQTLNIDVDAVNAGAGHYGICQWSVYYYPEVRGMNLDQQLRYLASDIEHQINSFGNNYQYGFNYDQFLQSNSAEQATLSFALTYERCGGNSYYVRQTNAIYAYQYFAN